MIRKLLASFLVLSVVLVPQLAVTSSADAKTALGTEETFTFTNVYEYDSNSYKKKTNYDTLKVTLQNELMDIDLDGTSLTKAAYTMNKNETTGTTLISASGNIDQNRYASIRLVFDEKENANGNIILTTSKKLTLMVR
ncbi:hypothetical protein [Paenibacillus xylanexedens]|uniref:hypothetical protein n=1 Tax=Paenibacillus xylanexedens TaxID=528191 RepID=UPI003B01ECB5